MLRAIYDRTLRLSQSPHALWALAAVAFIESSVFPIPPDVLLIPLIMARRDRAWLCAGLCTLASVMGGGVGYAIGALFYNAVGLPVLEFYGMTDKFAQFKNVYNHYGAWAVLMAGVTPFPYKVITILSGATGLDFGVFMTSSLIARSIRFFLIAALLWKFGPSIRSFIERRLGLVAAVSFVLLFGGFAVVKYAL